MSEKEENMGSQIEVIEERLKSFLGQLHAEYGILNRITYKNKNQHRRCAYFQYLLKVRRDLKLLQSAHLEEILNSSFHVIKGTKPKQKVQLLESLKRRRCDGTKYNFLERLLGTARLLSQMVEPMLKAAMEISTLLARSFFMGFSLTVMALLARTRVLVQQILLDVVTVFNMVSCISQKEQSIKIIETGCEVFREYYPVNDEAISLECVWETDKFVLRENVRSESRAGDGDIVEEVLPAVSGIQYQSIEAFLGDDEHDKTDPANTSEGGVATIEVDNDTPLTTFATEIDGKQVEATLEVEDGSANAAPASMNLELGLGKDSSLPPSSKHPRPQSGSKNKVAFVSVKKPPPNSNIKGFELKGILSKTDDKEDPCFSLLSGGDSKGSLF